jgi:hypothetical protein
MKKEELIEALANAPSFTEVDVTLRDSNEANELTREVIRVERRRNSKTGNEVINLICFKSLKEQNRYDKSALAIAKQIKESKRQAKAKAAVEDIPAPELTKAPDTKPMAVNETPDVEPMGDVKPMELKPMELKPMKIKKPTATMADLPKRLKELLAKPDTDQQGNDQAEGTPGAYDGAFENFYDNFGKEKSEANTPTADNQ